jgi:hypothetical protein
MLYFNSLSVPLKIVLRATLGTRAVGCRSLDQLIRSRSVKLATHLYPVPSIRGVIPLQPSRLHVPYLIMHGNVAFRDSVSGSKAAGA